jgi:hypothetical protein
MNFIAIIGIVHKIITKEKDPFTTIKIKVEKPFVENKDDK